MSDNNFTPNEFEQTKNIGNGSSDEYMPSAEPEAETENTEGQESNGETVQEDKAAGDSMKN